MTEKKLTKREKFEMVLAVEGIAANDELREFIEGEIAILDARAEKAKERAAKKAAEVDALGELVFGVISDKGVVTVADIVTALEDEDAEITSAKVVSRLTKLVNSDRVEKKEVSVDKRKLMTYKVKTEN